MRKAVLVVAGLLRQFTSDSKGQIALIFGLVSIALVMGVGSGIDLSRAYIARQRLSETAMLTCQYSTRPSVIDYANSTYSSANGFQVYLTKVNAFAAATLSAEHWTGSPPTGANSGPYFTATAAAGASTAPGSFAPTNAATDLYANVPVTFMQIANVSQIPVHAHITCNNAATTPQIANSAFLLSEGWEEGCTHVCYTRPNGTQGSSSTPTQTFPSSSSYTGSSGAQFFVTGYCLETDAVGPISAAVPEGTHTAELDCENGSSSAGNSSISTKVYLAVGNYELRYFYRGRIPVASLDPTYACATTAGDLSWVSDPTTTAGRAIRTNQINVYLDQYNSGSLPYHTTEDGTQQLAGTNLIDMCVYSSPNLSFVERSVKIVVTTPAFYWLSFAADGASDSYGGQIDNIRLCAEGCVGQPADNFPATWLSNNNGVLFEDTFDTPTYTASSPYSATNGNLSLSNGTSGATGSGWPSQNTSGWVTGPFNQIDYTVLGAYQGSQYITMDGYSSNGSYPKNRSASRSFVLDPGYYKVTYNYISTVNFAPSLYGVYCGSAPFASSIITLSYNLSGTARYHGSAGSFNIDTNTVGVFMANGMLISQPGSSGSLGAATTYTNPDGTTSTYPTAPTVPPDGVNYEHYNASQVNPLIDVCTYADSFQWVPRTANVEIEKAGLYWLTISGTAGTGVSDTGDGYGGGVDDVKLTALGSLYMSTPPTTALTTIPVPSPQPDTIYNNNGSFGGFYIIADPLTPPAADQ